MSFSAQQIADVLHGKIEGNPDVEVFSFSKIEEGRPGTITFLANPKYTHYIYDTKASIVLVNEDFIPEHPLDLTLIRVANAYSALAVLMEMVENLTKKKNVGIEANSFVSGKATIGKNIYIGAFTYICDNVKIGDSAQIYPQVYIGENVEIGKNTILYPGVKIYANCKIGSDCIIHAGVVIGADGFGFAHENGVYNKIPQLGIVVIEDNVEIGANTTIDRAVMGATVIHQGVKLDNLIQIAHNVEVGEHTAMASQVGISGSTKVGKNCVLGGQVGLGGHITIGDNSSIGAQSGIISNIKEGATIMGAPAIPVKDYFRSSIIFPKLPDMYKQLNKIQKELNELKGQVDNKK